MKHKFKVDDRVVIKDGFYDIAEKEFITRRVYENIIGKECKITEVNGFYKTYKLDKSEGFWFPECMIEFLICCDIDEYRNN